MRLNIITLTLTCIVLLSLGSCHKKPATFVLSGEVRDKITGTALPNAVVHERTHGKLRSRTDKNGKYRLEGIQLTEHMIYVSARGYELGRKKFPAHAILKENMYILNFSLEKKKPDNGKN